MLIKKILLFTAIAGLLFAFTGCGGPKVEKVDTDEVKEYADSAAEKIFTGISEENITLLSEDFDQQMTDAFTETKFKDIVDQLGKYESKEIIGADSVQGYTRVYYKTKFSKISNDVTFTIVFSETGDKKVSGLFYK